MAGPRHSVHCLSLPYFVVCSAITAQAIAQTKPLSSLAIAVATFRPTYSSNAQGYYRWLVAIVGVGAIVGQEHDERVVGRVELQLKQRVSEQIFHISKAHTESVVEPDHRLMMSGGNRYPW